MPDIFISYSKADHALALKLSAFLEAEGWTVWWDKSLGAADLCRDEIMKQLAAARAVITIWSPNSVRSDWVRAEAGRAKAEGKLIPVKTTDVAYADIPLPFGEMHTENVGSTDLIRAAIVAQLVKPAVTPSPFSQITGVFKYQVLTWIGIVGSAITLFSNLDGVVVLAGWARQLVAHWHEWTQTFWGLVFSLVNMRVPKEFVPIMSFIASVSILVAGVNLTARTVQRSDKLQHSPSVEDKVYILGGGVIVFLSAVFTTVAIMAGIGIVIGEVMDYSAEQRWDLMLWLAKLGSLIVYIGVPVGYLLYFAEVRSWVVVNSLLFLFMSVCLLFVPYLSLGDAGSDVAGLATFILFPICWMAVILFSPVQQLTRRLGFVVLGVLTLIGLSEISKLNLHQYLQPPKVSDNSVR